jgi:hypothetical protein
LQSEEVAAAEKKEGNSKVELARYNEFVERRMRVWLKS